ncbi:MAG: hypothetical protein LC748_15020 [Thermomicrobia bacterium]|nr:hypothetical protein [Thermomicrobia bacterium]
MVRELTRNETEAFIERHFEPHPDPVKQGDAWYRLRERGVPVYAIIGTMTPTFDNTDDVADAFAVLHEAVDAAVAYYWRHKEAIDLRLAA